MRFTNMLIPTLKESPSDAEVVSHRLMMRAGMIRKVASGVYNLLPLGLRVIARISDIVRSEMNSAGAQEVLLPMVTPAELWKESGRWDAYGKELLRFSDRHGRDFCLGPTHEEVITDLVRREVRSYRELPKNLYQVQTKFRDEIRPRFGLMRGREFIMKDAYSFHADDACAEREYRNMHETYCRIFERCGLKFRAVEAETGTIGGSFSHEFMVMADTGEDAIAFCDKCDYAANIERAEVGLDAGAIIAGEEKELKDVPTPGKKTIEEVSGFLGIGADRLIKTLVYESDKGVVVACVRGDETLNEFKLKRALGAVSLRLADEATVREHTGAPSGFAGPLGLGVPVYADNGVKAIVNGVTGANEIDAHLVNVNPKRDFDREKTVYADLKTATEGDKCPRCPGRLKIRRGIEVGHIFKLGTKYSEAMKAYFVDEQGKDSPMIMGCYGIGIGRTSAAAIEQNHDEAGIIWPQPISPFDCEIVPVNANDPDTKNAADLISSSLKDSGIDALVDDRDLRPGVKFKDADLIGIPVRITIGERNLKQGLVEVKKRGEAQTSLVSVQDAPTEAMRIIRQGKTFRGS
jgi:prolyl-tRNA synthetase